MIIELFEDLRPGQVVIYGDQEVIFVARLVDGYLFDTGLIVTSIGSIGVAVTDRFVSEISIKDQVSQTLTVYRMHVLNFGEMLSGKIYLEIDQDGMAKLRRVVVVDSLNKMVFDENGDLLNFDNNTIVDTGITFPEPTLTDEGRRLMTLSYYL